MTDLLLVTDSALVLQQAVGEILMLNEKTAEYGLTLTAKQAEALAVSRQAFNGTCGGSLELLADRELPAFSEQIHKGGKP